MLLYIQEKQTITVCLIIMILAAGFLVHFLRFDKKASTVNDELKKFEEMAYDANDLLSLYNAWEQVKKFEDQPLTISQTLEFMRLTIYLKNKREQFEKQRRDQWFKNTPFYSMGTTSITQALLDYHIFCEWLTDNHLSILYNADIPQESLDRIRKIHGYANRS